MNDFCRSVDTVSKCGTLKCTRCCLKTGSLKGVVQLLMSKELDELARRLSQQIPDIWPKPAEARKFLDGYNQAKPDRRLTLETGNCLRIGQTIRHRYSDGFVLKAEAPYRSGRLVGVLSIVKTHRNGSVQTTPAEGIVHYPNGLHKVVAWTDLEAADCPK